MEDLKKTALILDENLVQRKTIASYLALRFTCLDCKTAEQALQLLRERSFDIVIAGYDLGSGVNDDFLIRIKSIQPDTKLILLTRTPSEDLIRIAFNCGTDAILIKPMSAKTLYAKIQDLTAVSFLSPSRAAMLFRTLSIKVETAGHYTVICLFGKLIGTTFFGLRAKMESLMRKGSRHIALNLEKVTEIDKTGFQYLLSVFDILRKRAGTLCLFNVFNILGLITNHIPLIGALPIYLDSKDFRNSIDREGGCGMAYPRRIAGANG